VIYVGVNYEISPFIFYLLNENDACDYTKDLKLVELSNNDRVTQFSLVICNCRTPVFPGTIEKYLECQPFSSYGHIHMRFPRQHGQ